MRLLRVAGIALTALVFACGAAVHSSDPAPAVKSVAATEHVVGSGVDTLEPLPAAMTPSMTISQVLGALRSNPLLAPYLRDGAITQVEVGLYSNPALRYGGVVGVNRLAAYVIRGQAACAPTGGPAVTAASLATVATPRSNTCTGTIVADANTGAALMLREEGNG